MQADTDTQVQRTTSSILRLHHRTLLSPSPSPPSHTHTKPSSKILRNRCLSTPAERKNQMRNGDSRPCIYVNCTTSPHGAATTRIAYCVCPHNRKAISKLKHNKRIFYLDNGLAAGHFKNLTRADIAVGQSQGHDFVELRIAHFVDDHQGTVHGANRGVGCVVGVKRGNKYMKHASEKKLSATSTEHKTRNRACAYSQKSSYGRASRFSGVSHRVAQRNTRKMIVSKRVAACVMICFFLPLPAIQPLNNARFAYPIALSA